MDTRQLDLQSMLQFDKRIIFKQCFLIPWNWYFSVQRQDFRIGMYPGRYCIYCNGFWEDLTHLLCNYNLFDLNIPVHIIHLIRAIYFSSLCLLCRISTYASLFINFPQANYKWGWDNIRDLLLAGSLRWGLFVIFCLSPYKSLISVV